MKRIIYDGDPGIDDALAILFAAKSDKLEAITTVCGNVPLDMATDNALKILELTERRDIPVFKGMERPLLREPKHAKEFHGEDGLGNTYLPAPDIKPQSMHAVDAIVSKIMEQEKRGETTIVTAGPLTNLARVVEKEPSIKDYVSEVIVMGGAITVPGNVTRVAEFNIYCDPEATEKVFQSGLHITLVPLDVTTKNILTPNQLVEIEASGTKLTTVIGKMVSFLMKASKKYENVDGCCLHDPLAVAVTIDRSLVKTKMMNVAVETKGIITLGETVADLRAIPESAPNMEVCMDVDSKRFMKMFVETLKR